MPHDTLLRLRLDDEQVMPGLARRAVDEVIDHPDPEWRECVLLVVTELVTNAIVHTASPSSLRVRRRSNTVRIEVTDNERAAPFVRAPRSDEAGGRGMLLVSALADEWGVERTNEGKVVWAELTER
ncbi:Histidine kinase-like ATPase domain-containing protein [Prauserella marina]|uniref:Histidine kinase-like ATPase domain-containing protein n=1 Tax=Prauserella marina TaxID=530584 RepID=A0A1G6WR74_9PSEU|nr:ATP-binding protein [Prauserella marina]PWV73251.1 histidine kinase-like protein [Prauserella marina]SDD68163.1 Histidine kinase-like ATPase domain-containing protein [Prauserella marina]